MKFCDKSLGGGGYTHIMHGRSRTHTWNRRLGGGGVGSSHVVRKKATPWVTKTISLARFRGAGSRRYSGPLQRDPLSREQGEK